MWCVNGAAEVVTLGGSIVRWLAGFVVVGLVVVVGCMLALCDTCGAELGPPELKLNLAALAGGFGARVADRGAGRKKPRVGGAVQEGKEWRT